MTKCEGVARTQTSSISHFGFADLTLPIEGWGGDTPYWRYFHKCREGNPFVI